MKNELNKLNENKIPTRRELYAKIAELQGKLDKAYSLVVPYIQVKDSFGGYIRRVGDSGHDSLVLDGGIHYRNLQNGTGTQCEEEGYTFVGNDESEKIIEFKTVKEIAKKAKEQDNG